MAHNCLNANQMHCVKRNWTIAVSFLPVVFPGLNVFISVRHIVNSPNGFCDYAAG